MTSHVFSIVATAAPHRNASCKHQMTALCIKLLVPA